MMRSRLPAYLSQGFKVSMKRSMLKPCFIFNVCNNSALVGVLA